MERTSEPGHNRRKRGANIRVVIKHAVIDCSDRLQFFVELPCPLARKEPDESSQTSHVGSCRYGYAIVRRHRSDMAALLFIGACGAAPV